MLGEGRVSAKDLQGRGLVAQLVRLEQAASPEAIQSIVKELVTQLKKTHYHHLRRMLSVWLGRVVLKRAGISETIPDLQDLQEIDAMLEERAAEWKDEYIQQGVLIGEARGRAEGEAWGEAKGLGLALRDFLELRFGALPMSVTSRIAGFSDAAALRALTLSAYRAESLQTFMEQLQKKRQGHAVKKMESLSSDRGGMEDDIAFFEDHGIRRVYDEDAEVWYFSVVDIIGALTEQPDTARARTYWKVLKNRLKKEGSEVVTKCNQLKLTAQDGKKRLTDVADAETLLRLVQSVPSPKAEPVKLWLAQVGYERMREMVDPEIALNRSRELWRAHGRSEKWIEQRMLGQETRNKLTDYWKSHDIREGKEYAILTNIIHKEWSGVNVKDHKKMKGLKDQNLRDHMTEAELIFAVAVAQPAGLTDSDSGFFAPRAA